MNLPQLRFSSFSKIKFESFSFTSKLRMNNMMLFPLKINLVETIECIIKKVLQTSVKPYPKLHDPVETSVGYEFFGNLNLNSGTSFIHKELLQTFIGTK